MNEDIIKKIDILVEELNQIKFDYQTRLAEKEREIGVLYSRLQEREAILEMLEKKAAESSDSFEQQMIALEERARKVDELEKRLNSLDDKVCRNETIAYNLEDLLDDLKNKTEVSLSAEIKIDDFASKQDSIAADLRRIEHTIASFDSRLMEMETSISQLRKNINSESHQFAKSKQACEDVEKQWHDLQRRFDVGGYAFEEKIVSTVVRRVGAKGLFGATDLVIK